jgi:hypothetical protein
VPRPAAAAQARRDFRKNVHQKLFPQRTRARKNARAAEVPMKCGFSLLSLRVVVLERARGTRRSRALS